MKIFGIELKFPRSRPKSLVVDTYGTGSGWISVIREAWAGAWQQNMALDPPRDIISSSGVYSCVSGISTDIAKLCIELKTEDSNGIGQKVERNSPTSPYLAVLYKPNSYQTRYKFVEQWIVSKLIYGNTYVLKKRDARRVVRELYILDPRKVQVLVTESGDVYYKLTKDPLAELPDNDTVPASEVIHDMGVSLWHPLVGVSPIMACATSATLANKIQANSMRFFKNLSRPSGMLTAPTKISDEVADRLKKAWEENFGGENLGRIAIAGDGLEYKPFGMVPAAEAQLIEQLKWTLVDVANCFHYPMFKLGGEIPRGVTVEALNQVYYNDCLQGLIESMELCLDEGLELPDAYYTEFDINGLLRMDSASRLKTNGQAVKDGILSPDEARAHEDLPPVPGGSTPYLQQQNFSLAALAKRDAKADPFAGAKPAGGGGDSAGPDSQAQQDRASAQEALQDARAILRLAEQIRIALPAPAPVASALPAEDDDEVSEADVALFQKQVEEALRA